MLVSAASVALASGIPAATPAHAETEPRIAPVPGGWQVPLAHFGYERVTLKGQLASNEIFVPVTPGLTPASLTGTVSISPDVGGGYLEVRYEDDTLLTIVLEPQRFLTGTKITIPLDRAEVRDDLLSLKLFARIRTADNACESAVIGTRVTLEDGVIRFAGTAEPPASIGNYLPPILKHLRILVPDSPAPAEAEAALRIAAAAVDRYSSQDTIVDLRVGGGSLPSFAAAPFSRVIDIRRTGSPGARLTRSQNGPLLVFAGDADDLERASRTFTGGLAELAIGTRLQALEIDDQVPFSGDRYTFEALGFRQLQATGVGRIEIPLSFSQYGLGGSVRGLTVQLAGVHTPVASGAHATLGLLVNDVLVRAVELEATGEFTASLDVPPHLIQRDNSMTIRVDYAPDDGVCILGIHPFTIQISPASTLDVDRGGGSNEGFLRFPQALRNGFVVGFDEITPARVDMALDLIIAMQRLAGSPLQPTVLPWSEAVADERTGVLIVAGAGAATDLDPPLHPDGFKVVDAAGNVVLQQDAGARFAVLQAYERGDRDILMLTGREGPDLMARLTEDLLADAQGWFSLTGDLLVQPERGSPVNLNLRTRALRAEPLASPTRTGIGFVRSLSFPAAVVAALILLAFIYPRLVRKPPEEPGKE